MVVLSPGVAPDGTTNTVELMLTYANAWGYARAPNKLHVYDWIYQIA
jgi:hypothetical protein